MMGMNLLPLSPESTGVYSHVAIVTSETTTIHATLKYGVIEETLAVMMYAKNGMVSAATN